MFIKKVKYVISERNYKLSSLFNTLIGVVEALWNIKQAHKKRKNGFVVIFGFLLITQLFLSLFIIGILLDAPALSSDNLESDLETSPISVSSWANITGAWIWSTETLEINSLAAKASMAVDDLNRPHIAIYNITGPNDDLIYMKWNGSGWEIEELYNNDGTNPSIALDSANNPYVCFRLGSGTASVNCLNWNGTGWDFSVVEFESGRKFGEYLSMTIDDLDIPQVCYADWDNFDLRYAKWNGTGWESELVDAGVAGYAGYYCSIAVDSGNLPHISYMDNNITGSTYLLKHAYFNGTGWEIEVIDSDIEASPISIAVDSLNRSHISYCKNNHLKYAHYNNSWQTSIVELGDVTYILDKASIAVDSSDYPHICYSATSLPDFYLKYARWNGESWKYENFDETLDILTTSISIDSSDKPHICYVGDYGSGLGDVKYLRALYLSAFNLTAPTSDIYYIGENITITWQSFNADNVSLYLCQNRTGLDPLITDIMTIAAAINGSLGTHTWEILVGLESSSFYKIKMNSTVDGDVNSWTDYFRISPRHGWFIERIHDRHFKYNFEANYSSIVLDNLDMPHISYTDKREDILKYAYFDNQWHFETVDSNPKVGQYSSIALDSNETPHISYYDKSNQSLKYAYLNGSQWEIETVDSAGHVGLYTSIAVDSSDIPHIVYYDVTNTALKYARWAGTMWFIATVDSDGDVGKFASLKLDGSDQPHISYYNETGGDLKYAYFNAGWQIEIVDSDQNAGLYSSLDLNSSDQPHIAYVKNIASINLVWYAKWNGISWETEQVTPNIMLIDMRYTSLALDSLDRPHICYYNDTSVAEDALEYVYWNGSNWIFDVIDFYDWSHLGKCNSMALDSMDRPHISYYRMDRNIKYAFFVSEETKPTAPRSLQVNLQDGIVELTWIKPEDDGGLPLTEYRIYRGTNSGTEIYHDNVGPSTTGYTDSMALNNKTYYYYVTATNSIGESNQSNEIQILINISLLFIDDDGGQTYETYYEQALNDKGYQYRMWNYSSFGAPSTDFLKSHDVVIWSTADQSADTLTITDQNNLMQYLDWGGSLYLSSQDVLFEINFGFDGIITNTFVNDYLHITEVTNNLAYSTTEGVSTDPITDNFGNISLNCPFSNWGDEIQKDVGASTILTNPSNSNTTGIKVNNQTWKLVFTAFAFEGIQNQNATIGADFLDKIISWLLLYEDITPPSANHIGPYIYSQGSIGVVIPWIINDNSLTGNYRVERNDTLYSIYDWSQIWDNNTLLNIPINTSTIGIWNYTLYYNDSAGLQGEPVSIIVSIIDITPPSITDAPTDESYEVNSNFNISWTLADNEGGGYYRILRNGTAVRNWTSWQNGIPNSIPINTSQVGVWNYTIEYNDSSGLNGPPDTVIVNIYPKSTNGGIPGFEYLITIVCLFILTNIIIKRKSKRKNWI